MAKEMEVNQVTQRALEIPWEDDKKIAFYLDNVLSNEECAGLIRDTEEKGYSQALVNLGTHEEFRPNVRNSDRCIVDDQEKAEWIWQRVKEFVPEELTLSGTEYRVVGLNERLRFLRYDEGGYFKPHFDGAYHRPHPSTEQSKLTLQLYLNENFEGGETTFLREPEDVDRRSFLQKLMKTEDVRRVPCKPKPGRVLIFTHQMLHEGSLLKKGRKYAMRTDIMYDVKSN